MHLRIAMLFLLIPACCPAQPALESSFEEWDGGQAVGWDGEGITHSADARTGASALRVDLARTDRGNYRGLVYPTDTPRVEAGRLYRLRVWAKGRANVRLQLTSVADAGPDQVLSHEVLLDDEWTLLQLFHGVEDHGARRMRVVIVLGDQGLTAREDAPPPYAILDDISLEEVGSVGEPGANVLPNGDMETDADGDGLPDGWSGVRPLPPPDRSGPDGSRALVGWGGADPRAPAPDLAPEHWWSHAFYAFEEATWGTPATSPLFPVEAGRSYRVTVHSRGRAINRVLMRFEWLDLEGRPIPERISVVSPRRHGNWSWVADTMDFTAPSARVASGRMLWRTRASGGWLWLDNVTVRPLNGTGVGYVLDEPFTSEPVAAVAQALPARAPTAPAAQPVLDPPRPPQPRVIETDHAIEVALTGGVTLSLRLAGESLLGIGAVQIGDLPLRNADAPPIAPLAETASGGAWRDCRYLGAQVEGDTVRLHSALVREDGGEDRLDWTLEGTEREIAGETHRGFVYAWELRCADDAVLAIIDRATWELGGRAEGVTVITQDAYAVENVFTIGGDCIYAGSGTYRFAHGDGLDYQHSPAGALAVFHDEVRPRVMTAGRAWLEWIARHDTIPFAEERTARTPLKCVLYAPEGGHDHWTRVHDYVYDRFSGHWGAARETPLPIVGELMERRERNVETAGRTFFVMADEILPRIAPLGFEIVNCATLSGHLGLGMHTLAPAEELGGMAGLAHLCEAARRLGMSVQSWGPTARISQDSPLFAEKRHWLLEGPGGAPPTTYSWPTVRPCRMSAGWMEYALERYRAVRDATGLDCLWLDSYHNYTLGPRFTSNRIAIEQARDLFAYHGELSRMGYRIYTEATGTIGVPAPGLPVADDASERPALPDPTTRYRLSSHLGSAAAQEAVLEPGYYFRLLANQAPPMVSWLVLRERPEVHEEIARCNRAYTAVVEHMVRRTTLPDSRGVEWLDPETGTRVLFAYTAANHLCEEGTQVRDVTADRAVEVEGDAFAAEPMHVYLLTPGG